MVLPKKWKLFSRVLVHCDACLKNQAAISEFGLKPVLSHEFHTKKTGIIQFFEQKNFHPWEKVYKCKY